jgi:hypothetical protein
MTRDREVNLGDLDGVTVDAPGTTPSLSASPGGRDKKTPPGRKKTAPKPQKPTPSGGGNGGCSVSKWRVYKRSWIAG